MSSGIILRDAAKGYTFDQDKIRPPAETIAWARERLEALDRRVLLKTMRIDSGRLGIPVFISLCAPEAVALTGTQKQMGKGLTPEQSEASALMELIERFSFFDFLKRPPAVRAARQDLRAPALDLESLFLSLHDQTTDPDLGRAILSRLPLNWVWARNLTLDRDELIPLDWFYLINEYNGPAAGNGLEEAINQSLAEVVERHAASVVEHEGRLTPTIDPDSLPQGPAREALDRFRREGIVVHLKDFSLDTGIPTVAGLAWDPSTLGTSEIVFQAGTTTSPEKSVIRALTEIQQMACDFNQPTTYRATLPKFGSLEEALYILRPSRLKALQDLPDLSHPNLRTEIQAQVAALEKIGLSVYMIDVTHPELQVPAVYGVVPGAHFRARTRGSSVLFHAAKLAAAHPDEAESLDILVALAGHRPQDYAVAFFTGLALERVGRAEEALGCFRQALDLDPQAIDRPAVLTHLGVCLRDLDRLDEALAALGEARRLSPVEWEILHQLGVCLYLKADYDAAVESFLQAIEVNPGSGIDYANIGSCLRNQGLKKEAVRMYRLALDLDPGLDFARVNLAKLS